ncbi:MAG: hypothetical protein IPI44_21300 [Sulfuritalea sp.]|nr:hypothetical protein [Sulfuritalea sp.]
MAPLSELVGLPPTTASDELAGAADRRRQDLFARAAQGDTEAQQALVGLHAAYLVWAYGCVKAR